MKKNKYGLLKKDLAIVKIMMWSEGIEPMEIYFKYELKHWRKHKMRDKVKDVLATSRVKWAYENDFIAFAKTKKELKLIKGGNNGCKNRY